MHIIVKITTQYIENYNYEEKTPFSDPYYKFKGGDEFHIAVNVGKNDYYHEQVQERRALATALVFVNHFFCSNGTFNPTFISSYEVIDINTKAYLEDTCLEYGDTPNNYRIDIDSYRKADKVERQELEKYISIDKFKEIINYNPLDQYINVYDDVAQ